MHFALSSLLLLSASFLSEKRWYLIITYINWLSASANTGDANICMLFELVYSLMGYWDQVASDVFMIYHNQFHQMSPQKSVIGTLNGVLIYCFKYFLL